VVHVAAEAGEPHAKRRRCDEASELWGDPDLKLFRFTQKGASWQCTCYNPHHQDEGTTKCTKTRSGAIDGEEVALRLLKTWALEGLEVFSKRDHGDCWEEVVHAHRAGLLASTEELDARVWEIAEWPPADGA